MLISMLSTLEMAFIQYWERYISSVIIIIIISTQGKTQPIKTYNGSIHRSLYSSSFRDRGSNSSSIQPHRNHISYQPNWGQRKMKCY